MDIIFTIELSILAVIIIYQIVFFSKTRKKIRKLRTLFPNSDNIKFYKPVGSSFMKLVSEDSDISSEFTIIETKINHYLAKTKGSAEGGINVFANIIKREKAKLEDEIESQLSAPLYLGLAGTLIGIVFGLWHLMSATASSDFADLSNNAINGLFKSVAVAILVSLLGLAFVILNTNFSYKRSKVIVDANESDLLSKIEIELLPEVAESTASAIYSLRDYLSQFNKEFGKNLDSYKGNFGMMNDNLKSQEKVLLLLSKNNLADTAKEIAVVLRDIEEVAGNFKIFKDYQKDLIQSFENTKQISSEYNQTLKSFGNFNAKLDSLGEFIESNTEFNNQFKVFLANNFPEDESAREIYNNQWREVGSKLINDIGMNSKNVTTYFETVNSEVHKFATNNKSFFDSFSGFKQAIEVLIKNSEMSHKAFEMTHKNMDQLNLSVKDQNNSIKELTKTIKSTVV